GGASRWRRGARRARACARMTTLKEGENKKDRIRRVALNSFAVVVTLLSSSVAFAQDATTFNDHDKWIAVAAGIGIALAAFGGELGQGRTASTALDGIARNP